MRGKFVNLKLEDYVELYRNPQEHFVNKMQINEIFSMHGFLKLIRVSKAILTDELKTINLESPFRSTLKENISSTAFLNPDSVKFDLDALQWNECLIQSIQIHQSGCKENLPSEDQDLHRLPANSNNSSMVAVSNDNGGKSKPKRKRRSLKKLATVAVPPPPPPPPPTADVSPSDSSCLSIVSVSS